MKRRTRWSLFHGGRFQSSLPVRFQHDFGLLRSRNARYVQEYAIYKTPQPQTLPISAMDEVLWAAVVSPRDYHFADARRALAHGANASTICPNGRTALWSAVRYDSPRTVKLLLDAGATATIHGTAIAMFNLSLRQMDVGMLHNLFTSGVLDTIDESSFNEELKWGRSCCCVFAICEGKFLEQISCISYTLFHKPTNI